LQVSFDWLFVCNVTLTTDTWILSPEPNIKGKLLILGKPSLLNVINHAYDEENQAKEALIDTYNQQLSNYRCDCQCLHCNINVQSNPVAYTGRDPEYRDWKLMIMCTLSLTEKKKKVSTYAMILADFE
jgi:hypothetical protein